MLNTAHAGAPVRASGNAALPGTDTRTKIGLLCELTNGNLGNAAFEAAAIQHLLRFYPGAEIYVSAADSLETFKSHKVRLFPLNAEAERRSRAPDQPRPAPSPSPLASTGGWRSRLKKIPLM